MDKNLGEVILQAFLEKTGGRNLICVVCGGTRWESGGLVSLSLQDNIEEGIIIGGKILPLINVTCEACGNTLLLNIIRLLGRERFNELMKDRKVDRVLEEIQKSMEREGGT